ncbi:MAG: patatin-like phospholipase family protein [Bdellovibrionales bacterium]|nr:patatin-like phospholipase family protein [Bdellovibrionales bacterium]
MSDSLNTPLSTSSHTHTNSIATARHLGLVLSGGGSRAAYQVGVLKALRAALATRNQRINVIVGSSLGAINGIVLGACQSAGIGTAIEVLESLWRERTYANTFRGSISRSFLRAVQVAVLRYSAPGPCASDVSIFDPTPLRERVNSVLADFNGLRSELLPRGDAIAVMTTLEGERRRPMLLTCAGPELDPSLLKGSSFDLVQVQELTAEHGFASAALPSVLPAVDLNIETRQVRLVDGGICDNIPVDPAVRLGSDELILIDASGRRWWFDHYGQPHYTRPTWEVPAEQTTYCLCPTRMLECSNREAFGPLLKHAVGSSRRDFILALGPTWPIFRILKHKMGESLAYEVMSYVALHPQYIDALIEQGYREALAELARRAPSETPLSLVAEL